jgi:hypothetical protein
MRCSRTARLAREPFGRRASALSTATSVISSALTRAATLSCAALPWLLPQPALIAAQATSVAHQQDGFMAGAA